MSDESSRILVVEDEPLSRDMITRRLERRGFIVESAADGKSCLERLNGSTTPPDAILMDVQMPGLSGLEVLTDIRKRFTHDALPVILVTALGETEDIVRGLEAGANDYVVKPIVFPVLLARLTVRLRISQTVRLLMEAERQRVVVAALGEACHQLAQPMQAAMITLQSLILEPDMNPAVSQELKQVLSWTEQVAAVIHRLQEAGTMREVPFTRRMEMLDDGTRESMGKRPR
jgi:DNA-binding response OmpR family regulator